MSNEINKYQEIHSPDNAWTWWDYSDTNYCFIRTIHTRDGSVFIRRYVRNVRNEGDVIMFQFFYMGNVYTERILNSNYSLRYTITLAKRFAKETVKIVNSYLEDEL